MLQYNQTAPLTRATRSHFAALIAAVLVALLLIVVVAPAADSATTQLIGQPAPDFALRSLGNENLRLSEHQGEVVVINFWATWCGPCRQEMPLLDELYGKYRRAGLVLLSVNIDDAQDRAIEMAGALQVSYPVLLDVRKEVARAYQVGTMPVTVLIDREGVVRYVSEGYKPGYERRYTDQVRELLNQ
jgi:thiol-disulfide isomerase/thioredoxin